MPLPSTEKANQETLIKLLPESVKYSENRQSESEDNHCRKKPKGCFVLCTLTYVYCVSAVVIHSLEFSPYKI